MYMYTLKERDRGLLFCWLTAQVPATPGPGSAKPVVRSSCQLLALDDRNPVVSPEQPLWGTWACIHYVVPVDVLKPCC